MFVAVAVNLMDKVDRLINIIRTLKEEGMVGAAPTNSLVGGNIAGTPEADPGNPPVNRKRPTILARGLMPGSRKRWMNK